MGSLLDLVGIGIDIAQTRQIYKARSELERLKAGAQAAAERQMILEILRNFIFDIAQDVRMLEKHLETLPLQSYTVARALKWRIKDSGISPEIFPDLADKEYVQEVLTSIDSIAKRSREHLSNEQLARANTATDYIIEGDLLARAIEAKSALEDLQVMDLEWKKASKQASHTSSLKSIGCLGLIGTFTIVPMVLMVLVGFMGSISEILASISMVFSIGVWLVCLVGSIVLLGKGKPQRYRELQAQREALREKLLPADEWNRVVQLWGDLPSQGYRKIQAERQRFLNGIFGQIEGFDKFMLPGQQSATVG